MASGGYLLARGEASSGWVEDKTGTPMALAKASTINCRRLLVGGETLMTRLRKLKYSMGERSSLTGQVLADSATLRARSR
jgi:hypothetical protein